MALRDSWRRALVISGLVDGNPHTNHDYLQALAYRTDPPAPLPAVADLVAAPTLAEPPVQAPFRSTPHAGQPSADHPDEDPERIVVRRLEALRPAPAAPVSSDAIEKIFAHEGPAGPPPTASLGPRAAVAPPPTQPREVSVHRVAPRAFNDAQQLADRYKALTPVILDLQGVESDLAKRLIGFASGLTYGLDGSMERLDARVFLLTPRGVELPAAQRARLAAQGSLHKV